MRKYDKSSLEPAVDIVGRRTFSTLALPLIEGAATVCVPVECTDIRTAAKESCTSSVSNVQSGKGHLHLGMFQDGSSHCTNCYVNLLLPYLYDY